MLKSAFKIICTVVTTHHIVRYLFVTFRDTYRRPWALCQRSLSVLPIGPSDTLSFSPTTRSRWVSFETLRPTLTEALLFYHRRRCFDNTIREENAVHPAWVFPNIVQHVNWGQWSRKRWLRVLVALSVRATIFFGWFLMNIIFVALLTSQRHEDAIKFCHTGRSSMICRLQSRIDVSPCVVYFNS